jgi:hypothetical protein
MMGLTAHFLGNQGVAMQHCFLKSCFWSSLEGYYISDANLQFEFLSPSLFQGEFSD